VNSYYLIRNSADQRYAIILKNMPALRLRFKKKNDGQCVLTAVRVDGSSTSSNIGTVGGYGPVHDLTHLVVERTLGIRNGFLGCWRRGATFRISIAIRKRG
jgi:hypothetical protein